MICQGFVLTLTLFIYVQLIDNYSVVLTYLFYLSFKIIMYYNNLTLAVECLVRVSKDHK
jgi:hypothetical protein